MIQKTEYQQQETYSASGSSRSTERETRLFDLCSLSALTVLLISLILISFDLRLPAGIMTVAGIALAMTAYKKGKTLFRQMPGEIQTKTIEISKDVKQQQDISDISHRLREHLNDLVLISDFLLNSDLPKKQKEIVMTLSASTKNLVSVVNELTIKPVPEIRPEHPIEIRFNILSAIQNTIRLYNLKQKSFIDLVLTKRDYSDFECEGDPVLLKQIFLSLFMTIEDHCDGRTVRTNINVRRENKDSHHFDAHFRIQTDKIISFTDMQTMAVKLISSANGKYYQEDGENYSVFNFTLPFAIPAASVKAKYSRSEEVLSPEKRRAVELKDSRILIVEDNLLNQKTLILTISQYVSKIDTAANGQEALEKIESEEYDIILMDIRMPVMDGLMTTEKIREIDSARHSHTPIIAITAYAMPGDEEKCLSAGIDDYISKPFDPSVLIEKLNGILQRELITPQKKE